MSGRSSPPDRVIAVLAAEQYGAVARWQLYLRGFHDWEIDYRVQIGRLHLIHEGVYAVGSPYLSADGHLMAAVLAFGPGAVLSHRTAAEVYAVLPRSGGRPHVSSDARSLVGRPGIVLHRCRSLAPGLRTVVDGIPVTTLPRVLLDLATHKRDDRLVKRAWQNADRLRLLDVQQVIELVDNSPGRRTKPLKVLIERALDTPDTREELEARFADLIEDDPDIPTPLFNASVGAYIVDAAWVDQRVIVELDSRAFHDDDEAFETDRVRYAELQLAGWRVYPVTWRELSSRPAKVRDRLRRLLRTAPSPTPAARAGGA
jgi:hypothetical protein